MSKFTQIDSWKYITSAEYIKKLENWTSDLENEEVKNSIAWLNYEIWKDRGGLEKEIVARYNRKMEMHEGETSYYFRRNLVDLWGEKKTEIYLNFGLKYPLLSYASFSFTGIKAVEGKPQRFILREQGIFEDVIRDFPSFRAITSYNKNSETENFIKNKIDPYDIKLRYRLVKPTPERDRAVKRTFMDIYGSGIHLVVFPDMNEIQGREVCFEKCVLKEIKVVEKDKNSYLYEIVFTNIDGVKSEIVYIEHEKGDKGSREGTDTISRADAYYGFFLQGSSATKEFKVANSVTPRKPIFYIRPEAKIEDVVMSVENGKIITDGTTWYYNSEGILNIENFRTYGGMYKGIVIDTTRNLLHDENSSSVIGDTFDPFNTPGDNFLNYCGRSLREKWAKNSYDKYFSRDGIFDIKASRTTTISPLAQQMPDFDMDNFSRINSGDNIRFLPDVTFLGFWVNTFY